MKRFYVITAATFLLINNGALYSLNSPLNHLAFALNQLAIDQEPPTGTWIVNNHPKTLLYHEKRTINKITVPVYQFNVSQQKSMECGFHAPRNTLYVMDMLHHPCEQFASIYQAMKSKTLYESYVQATGLKRCAGVRTFQLDDSTIEKILKQCKPPCLPQNSIVYHNNTVTFSYFNNKKDARETISLWQEQFFTFLNSNLRAIEKSVTKTELSDIVSLGPVGYSDLKKFIQKLNANQNYTLGIDISTFTVMPHAVSLVIHKKNGSIEYFFSDSLNSPLDKNPWDSNYWATIDKIITFTQDYVYFEKTLIRYLFYYYLFYRPALTKQPPTITDLISIHTDIKKIGLQQHKLYTDTYKPALCKKVKEHKQLGAYISKKGQELIDEIMYNK